LGGVARKTRESMLLCEAAGYDVILVETVGVGQSETVVAEMVDLFLVLMLPGAGDELQGIKRGILELADILAVNKADANPAAARLAKRDYLSALKLMHGATGDARRGGVPVLLLSGLSGDGVDILWQHITEQLAAAKASGRLDEKRLEQLRRWMWSMVEHRVLQALRTHPEVERIAPELEADVLSGKLTPTLGAQSLLRAFGIDDER
jgi:LAO/AO transport system kinase